MPNGVQIDSQRYAQLQDVRGYWQPGGPGTPKYYFDESIGAFFVTGSIIPRGGAINPIFIPDPNKSGRYKLIGRTREAPELPQMTVEAHEKKGGIPRQYLTFCDQNIYLLRGICGDLADFYNGWEDYIQILSRARIESNIDQGARSQREGDDPLSNTITLKGVANYVKGALSFGEEAATDVVVEVIDGVFSPRVDCAQCGIPNDGSQIAYVVTRANVGSPSAPGQVLYTVDGGVNWAAASITGIGTTAEPRYIDIAGGVLFVGTDATSLFISTISNVTAAPGTWSAVTLPVAMTDAFVASPSAIYFSAASGSVYKTSSIGTAPTLIANGGGANLARIHGNGEVVVAVGASGAVYYTTNAGTTWALAAVPVAADLVSVQVKTAREWWVLTSTNRTFKTTDQGNSWTEVTGVPNNGTGTGYDILWVTDEIGYVSSQVDSVARLAISVDGGNTWAADSGTRHIQNWPTASRFQRLAAPSTEAIVAANYLLACGLAAGGTDGLLLLAAPTLV